MARGRNKLRKGERLAAKTAPTAPAPPSVPLVAPPPSVAAAAAAAAAAMHGDDPTASSAAANRLPWTHEDEEDLDDVAHACDVCDHHSVPGYRLRVVSRHLRDLFITSFVHSVPALFRGIILQNLQDHMLEDKLMTFVEHGLEPLHITYAASAPAMRSGILSQLRTACEDDLAAVVLRLSTEDCFDLLCDLATRHGRDLTTWGPPCACSFARCLPCLERLVDSVRSDPTGNDALRCASFPTCKPIQPSRLISWIEKGMARGLVDAKAWGPANPTSRDGVAGWKRVITGAWQLMADTLFQCAAEIDPMQLPSVKRARKILSDLHGLDLYYAVVARELAVLKDPDYCSSSRYIAAGDGSSCQAHGYDYSHSHSHAHCHHEPDSQRTRPPSPKANSELSSPPFPAIVGGVNMGAAEAFSFVRQFEKMRRAAVKAPAAPPGKLTGKLPAIPTQAQVEARDEYGESHRYALGRAVRELGNGAYIRGSYAEACEHYTRAMAYDASEPVYPLNRAACYLKLNRFNEAEADCSAALTLDPTNHKAYFRRGVALSALLKVDDAERDFMRVLRLNSANEQNYEGLKQLADRCLFEARKRLAGQTASLPEDDAVTCISAHSPATAPADVVPELPLEVHVETPMHVTEKPESKAFSAHKTQMSPPSPAPSSTHPPRPLPKLMGPNFRRNKHSKDRFTFGKLQDAVVAKPSEPNISPGPSPGPSPSPSPSPHSSLSTELIPNSPPLPTHARSESSTPTSLFSLPQVSSTAPAPAAAAAAPAAASAATLSLGDPPLYPPPARPPSPAAPASVSTPVNSPAAVTRPASSDRAGLSDIMCKEPTTPTQLNADNTLPNLVSHQPSSAPPPTQPPPATPAEPKSGPKGMRTSLAAALAEVRAPSQSSSAVPAPAEPESKPKGATSSFSVALAELRAPSQLPVTAGPPLAPKASGATSSCSAVVTEGQTPSQSPRAAPAQPEPRPKGEKTSFSAALAELRAKKQKQDEVEAQAQRDKAGEGTLGQREPVSPDLTSDELALLSKTNIVTYAASKAAEAYILAEQAQVDRDIAPRILSEIQRVARKMLNLVKSAESFAELRVGGSAVHEVFLEVNRMMDQASRQVELVQKQSVLADATARMAKHAEEAARATAGLTSTPFGLATAPVSDILVADVTRRLSQLRDLHDTLDQLQEIHVNLDMTYRAASHPDMGLCCLRSISPSSSCPVSDEKDWSVENDDSVDWESENEDEAEGDPGLAGFERFTELGAPETSEKKPLCSPSSVSTAKGASVPIDGTRGEMHLPALTGSAPATTAPLASTQPSNHDVENSSQSIKALPNPQDSVVRISPTIQSAVAEVGGGCFATDPAEVSEQVAFAMVFAELVSAKTGQDVSRSCGFVSDADLGRGYVNGGRHGLLALPPRLSSWMQECKVKKAKEMKEVVQAQPAGKGHSSSRPMAKGRNLSISKPRAEPNTLDPATAAQVIDSGLDDAFAVISEALVPQTHEQTDFFPHPCFDANGELLTKIPSPLPPHPFAAWPDPPNCPADDFQCPFAGSTFSRTPDEAGKERKLNPELDARLLRMVAKVLGPTFPKWLEHFPVTQMEASQRAANFWQLAVPASRRMVLMFEEAANDPASSADAPTKLPSTSASTSISTSAGGYRVQVPHKSKKGCTGHPATPKTHSRSRTHPPSTSKSNAELPYSRAEAASIFLMGLDYLDDDLGTLDEVLGAEDVSASMLPKQQIGPTATFPIDTALDGSADSTNDFLRDLERLLLIRDRANELEVRAQQLERKTGLPVPGS